MHETISRLLHDSDFVRLTGLGENLYLKLESLNPAGSIKLKTALGLVDDLQSRGLVREDTILIESSSGNLGVALSMVCAERGLRFTCVVDPNSSPHNVKTMRAYGTDVVMVDQVDANGGYLGTRIAHIRALLASDPRYVWLNQYENPANPRVHAATTAASVAGAFPRLDYLFVGAGTTGTLMGCMQYFRRNRPETRIVAVDTLGSVTFGMAPGKRYIPGLGTSQRPPIFDPEGVHALELVPEAQTVAMCRHLARKGLLVGGSTGTVLAAAYAWRDRLPPGAVAVALSPDWGERYLDTIYDDAWVRQRFDGAVLTDGLAVIDRGERATTVFTGGAQHAPAFHVVDGRCVEQILAESPKACIDDVEQAYLAHHAGHTVNPDSYFLRFPDRPADRIIALPASLDGGAEGQGKGDGVCGIKWIASFPGNIDSGLQRASAALLLNDPRTGYPYACVEASRISAARTAASAVLAARWLRAQDRHIPRLGVVGAGFIARGILDMFAGDGWQAGEVLVHDLHAPSAQALVAHAQAKHGMQAAPAGSLEDVLQADVVVLATTAGTPYIRAWHFMPHQCVLNISLRDLAPEILLEANNLFDDVEHCMKANTSPHLAEQKCGHRRFATGTLAQLMRGEIRLDPRMPTIFSPFGLGVLDLAVGRRAYQEAKRRGRAVAIPNFFHEPRRW